MMDVSDAPTPSAAPPVLRVYAMSENGAPYELHYPQARAPRADDETPCPVDAAQALVDAFRDEHPAWIEADLAALRRAVEDWADGGDRATAYHAAHGLAGTAELASRARLTKAAATLADRLGPEGRTTVAGARASLDRLVDLAVQQD